jgi:hypothetical protein
LDESASSSVETPITNSLSDQNIDSSSPQTNYSNNQSKQHPILYLSDKDFISTPLSVMMSWYGEASGGGTCADDFGNSLVERWRREQKTYCHKHEDQPTKLNSLIDCYLVRQTRHAGQGDNLCWMKNVSVNLKLFNNDKFTSSVVENYVNTRHAQQPYLPFRKGFINADCKLDHSLWQGQYFPGWNVDWTFHAVTTEINQDGNTAPSCSDQIDHNVLVVQRDTFANFFHDSEDFFNTFLAMSILEWKLEDTQIYLTDLYPNGPFW